MKKAIKVFSVLIISLFINIIVATADGCAGVNIYTDGKGTSDSTGSTGQSSFKYGGNKYTVWSYYVKINGTRVAAICHNPGLHAWTNSGQKLNCERALYDPTSSDTKESIYDAGIVWILEHAKNKWMAINLYQLLFKDRVAANYKEADLGSDQLFHLENQINKYLDTNSNNSKAKKLQEKIKELRKTYGGNVGKTYSGVSRYNDSNGVDSAMDDVLSALDAAIDYAKNGGPTITISNNPTRKKQNTETELKTTFTYKINIASFSENSEAYVTYNCLGGCNIATSVKFYLNGSEKTASELSSTNLVKLVTYDDESKKYSGSIELVIEFTGPVQENCNDINYQLNLKYKEQNLQKQAYEIDECSSLNSCQRLYALLSSGSSSYRNASVNNTFQLCNTPKELGTCKTYVGNGICEPCEEDDNVIEIKEGYDVNDACTTPSDDTLNIKKCVANDGAKDTVGNTHKSNDYTKEAGSSNIPSGGIYCKEDYTLTFPGSRKVDSGRYFILRAQAEGIKSCYTTKIKEPWGTNSSVKAAAKATWAPFKELRKYKKMAECVADRSCVTRGYRLSQCTPYVYPASEEECSRERYCYCTSSKVPIEGQFDEEGNQKTYTKVDCEYRIPRWDIIPTVFVMFSYDSGASTCNQFSEGYQRLYSGLEFGIHSGCKLSNSSGSIDNADAIADSLIEQAIGAIGRQATVTGMSASGDFSKGDGSVSYSVSNGFGFSAQLGTGGMYSILQQYNKVIGFYTGGSSIGGGTVTEGGAFETSAGGGSGSYGVKVNPHPFGGWKVDYNFNPELYFWYQESYRENLLSEKLESFDDTLERLAPEYCTGDVSDDYRECYGNGGWKKNLTMGGIGDTNADVYQDQECACTTERCDYYNYAIANVKYIKQSTKATTKFVSPTQFYNIYPTGTVPAGYPGLDIDNASEIESGLPIELRGSSGGKTYLLWYKNLGEYYDTDNLGRIWGDNNSVVAATLQASYACGTDRNALVFDNETDGVYHDGGVYVCRYDVNECNKCVEESDDYCDPTCPNDPDCSGEPGCSSIKDGYCNSECPDDPDCYCPECPPDIKNSCAILKDEAGGSHYYDPNGKEVNYGVYYSKCCPNGHCKVNCQTCLFDGTELKAQYRQVSNEDINPNKRTLGNNWAWDGVINTAIELKAYVTTKEITDNSNAIFEVDFDNPENNDNQDFALEATMDPKTINWIQNYNESADGGYLNNTLECYDLELGEKVYKNVYCYSTFIDEMIKNDVGNIKIAGSERPMDENARREHSNGYFISWNEENFNTANWEVRTERGLEFYTTNFGIVYDSASGRQTDYRVGPSWK